MHILLQSLQYIDKDTAPWSLCGLDVLGVGGVRIMVGRHFVSTKFSFDFMN